MALEIRLRKTSDTVVIDLIGRLDVLGQSLSSSIIESIKQGERHFVLNLMDLEFVDAFGLGQLVEIRNAVAGVGGSLKIFRPGARIRELFALTRLDTVLEIYEEAPRTSVSDVVVEQLYSGKPDKAVAISFRMYALADLIRKNRQLT
jgi:anti-anti-sigma factor